MPSRPSTKTPEERLAIRAEQARLRRQKARAAETEEEAAARREKERLRSVRRRAADPEKYRVYRQEWYRRTREAAGFTVTPWAEKLEQAAMKRAVQEADREAARWQREYRRQEKLRLAVLRDIEKQERKVKAALERKEKQAREVVKKQMVRPVVPGEDPDPVRAGVICTRCSIHMVTDGVYVWCDKCGREAA